MEPYDRYESGAQVDSLMVDGWYALMSASKNGRHKVAKLLLERGAEVDLQDSNGWTSLMYASKQGHYEVANLLLQRSAQVDLCNVNGRSSLMHASYEGHTAKWLNCFLRTVLVLTCKMLVAGLP